jgi:hypothetical protein
MLRAGALILVLREIELDLGGDIAARFRWRFVAEISGEEDLGRRLPDQFAAVDVIPVLERAVVEPIFRRLVEIPDQLRQDAVEVYFWGFFAAPFASPASSSPSLGVMGTQPPVW